MDEEERVATAAEDRIRARLALQMVAISTGMPLELIVQTRNKGRMCRARWMAMYLAHVTFGWPLERVGHAFGMNRATVSTACRWGEDERDRPIVDETLDRLERCVRLLIDAPVCELPA
jgi:chromosomal replication initiation ATPase DnaA